MNSDRTSEKKQFFIIQYLHSCDHLLWIYQFIPTFPISQFSIVKPVSYNAKLLKIKKRSLNLQSQAKTIQALLGTQFVLYSKW